MKKSLMIALLFPVGLMAQDIKQADKNFAMLNYDEAASGYLKALDGKKKKNAEVLNVELLTKLANSYYLMKDYPNAKKYFSQAYDALGNNMNELDFMRLINSIRAIGDKDRADELLMTYYSKNTQRAKMLSIQKAYVDSLESEYEKVMNLAINSPLSDFGYAMKGSEVAFTSNRGGAKAGQTPYYNIYTAVRNPNNGQLSNVKEHQADLNTNYHDASLVYFNDIVFFSRNFLTKKEKLDAPHEGISNVRIMRGRLDGDKIVDVVELEFNHKDYNCSHPFVTADGKYFLFSSDKPGGQGGSDIYIADLYKDGTMSEPVNAGPMINTAGSELFPSISGDTLFFSSDFHYGFGGLDVFQSVMKGKTNFSIPENLGNVINSTADDFAFIRLNNRTGYVSSNRKGGQGDDDIYMFEMVALRKSIDYAGITRSKSDNSPLGGVKMEVYNQLNEKIAEYTSDANGKYKAELPLNSQLKLVFSKPEFSTETVNVTTPEKAKDSDGNEVKLTSFSSLIDRDGNVEKIKVEPIYFDLGKWDITPQAEVELNKILYAMNAFPTIRIKIESHTDSRGSDAANLKLSDNRAKSTMRYLIEKGIDPSRIEFAKGYGETRLKNRCKNGVNCSEEEHSVNRRSDFIIISK